MWRGDHSHSGVQLAACEIAEGKIHRRNSYEVFEISGNSNHTWGELWNYEILLWNYAAIPHSYEWLGAA